MGQNNNENEKDAKPSCCTRFKTSMHNAGRFIFNPDTKEVLGRTGFSWLQVLSFYLVFYAVLAGFWATCMVCFIKTLDPVAPTMQKMYSMMKDNPGMNFEPFPDTSTTLIYFNPNNESTYKTYVDRLSSVYSGYVNQSEELGSLKRCSMGNGATWDNACQYDYSSLGNSCTPANDFGYKNGKPCVLLKINKVFLWEPNNITFDTEDKCKGSDKTNQNCAKQLEFSHDVPKTVKSEVKPGYISVSCEGENDGDADNINSVTFYPSGGFPAYFYPYYNQPNFTAPSVMAQFDVVPGRVSMILCKFWTRDVIHDKNDLQGSIHIELMVGP